MAYNIEDLYEVKQLGFQFFSAYKIRYGYQLFALIDMGVCAARIGGQLAHQLDMLEEKTNIEIRAIVNDTDTYIGFKPEIGSWIRPEDLVNLPQIDVCEFMSKDIAQEQALYRVYAERHEWPGRLKEIIPAFNNDELFNRLIPEDFGARRANCRQSCMNGGSCQYCGRTIKLSTLDFALEAIRAVKGENEEE